MCELCVSGYLVRLVFSDTSALPLHYYKKLYSKRNKFLKLFSRFQRQSGKIHTLLLRETVLKTALIVSVALGNCRSERTKRF